MPINGWHADFLLARGVNVPRRVLSEAEPILVLARCLTQVLSLALLSCSFGMIKLFQHHKHSAQYVAPERLPFPSRNYRVRCLGLPPRRNKRNRAIGTACLISAR